MKIKATAPSIHLLRLIFLQKFRQ
ncbi:MAG: hypothetical protein ACLRR3_02325 [Eubacterium sp.]